MITLLVAAFVAARIVVGAGGRVFTSYDTYTYALRNDPAVDRGPVVSIFGHSPRLPGLPVFYALFPDDVWRVWAQWTIGTVAWALLAVALWATLSSLAARVVAALGVMSLGLVPAMTNWDFAILSEALSISLGVLTLACFLLWRRSGSVVFLAGTAGAGAWWAFVRPETRLPVGVLALAVLWVAWRASRTRPTTAPAAAGSSGAASSGVGTSGAVASDAVGGDASGSEVAGSGVAGSGVGGSSGPDSGETASGASGVAGTEQGSHAGAAPWWQPVRWWVPGARGPLVATGVLLLAIGWVTAITPTVTHTFPGWSATGLSLEEETLNYRLRLQVLPDPEISRVFREDLGMPDCPAANAVAAGKEWAIAEFAEAYRSCPELKAWGEENATSSGYRYALAAPDQYLGFLRDVLPRSLSGIVHTEVGQVLPAPVERLIFPPRQEFNPQIGVPLVLAMLLSVFTRRWLLWGSAFAVCVISAATILAGLSLSVGEYARFGIQEAAGFRIALIIAVALLIDAAASWIRTRLATRTA
ncbi:hypothetical protein J2S43_008346 [Catenuloplanes nepalensis]|uniref:Glycosyltransferase RgtA/B/C/D-like domain-containing protein n=1 Tax=Catenuloplanes nepalensis TaxID=587533 RepID=A0ABT9N814_9ACTN|nr:hypothetical protein [Catenuloplanes nepalensis]MDP9799834.1 hypothetical protein [Catenuloplanes nepalensis]